MTVRHSTPPTLLSLAALVLLAGSSPRTLEAITAQTLPKVHLVATGGTISNRQGGRLTAEELAKSMPGLERFATLSFEQFSNVASTQLTLEQWIRLARR